MTNRSLACALAATLCSCAGTSTQLKEVQVAPQPPAGRPTKALVIGLSGKPDVRATFEGDMASRLQKMGITAVQGQAVMPEGQPITVDDLRAVVKKEGADAVVIARLLGTHEQQVLESGPPMPTGFYGYYAGMAPYVYSPTYLTTEQVVTLETRLYRTAGDGQLVWRAVSETIDPTSATEGIRSVNEKTVARMHKDGVI